MTQVGERAFGVRRLYAQDQGRPLALGRLRENFHPVHPFVSRQACIFTGHLRPNHALDAAAVHEIHFTRQIFVIDGFVLGEGRRHDGEGPAEWFCRRAKVKYRPAAATQRRNCRREGTISLITVRPIAGQHHVFEFGAIGQK